MSYGLIAVIIVIGIVIGAIATKKCEPFLIAGSIIGALLIGVSRKVSAEFTFYLAVPVMFGASLLKIVKYGLNFTGTEIALLILGMITAFIVSLWIIKFLMNYIKKHDFKVFGWYRIVLGIIVLICGFAGVIGA